jgi:geranylgeranyl pyrophosphate synthase
MESGEYDSISRNRIDDAFRAFGIIEEVRELAYDFASKARKNLEVLHESEYRDALGSIPYFVIERNR